MATTQTKVDVLAGLALDAGRAYQENVSLYGEAQAKHLHDESNLRIAAVAELIEAAALAEMLTRAEAIDGVALSADEISRFGAQLNEPNVVVDRLRAALARIGK